MLEKERFGHKENKWTKNVGMKGKEKMSEEV